MKPEDRPRGAPENVARLTVTAYDRTGVLGEQPHWVIRERPVTIYLNGEEVVTLLCAGHHLEELAVGFLHAEGFLSTPEDIAEMEVEEDAGAVRIATVSENPLAGRLFGKRLVTSGCGKGTVFYHAIDAILARPVAGSLRVTPVQIIERMSDLNHMSETYRRTHGVHNSALATAGGLLVFRDDIGRHNAVDMVLGHAFLNRVETGAAMLVTTGRVTSEVLIKCAKAGIPAILSRNTATSLAVEIARRVGVTVIGYARAGRFICYAGCERIVAP